MEGSVTNTTTATLSAETVHVNVTSPDVKVHRAFVIPFLITLSITVILGIMANSVLLMTIYKRPPLHRVPYYLASALATTDLMICVISMVVFPQTLLAEKWAFGRALCVPVGFVTYWFAISEFFLMGALSLDKYFACCRPLNYVNIYTTRRCLLMVGFCFLFAGGLALLPVCGCGSYNYDDAVRVCRLEWVRGTEAVICNAVIFSMSMVPCTLVIAVCQYKVIKEVRKIKPHPAPRGVSPGDQRHSAVFFTKATRTVSLVVGLYLIGWIPFISVRIAHQWFDSIQRLDTLATLEMASVNVAFLRHFINPLIYGMYNTECRIQCLVLFKQFNNR